MIAMYRANFKFIECKLHLEVEEVLGSMNQRSNFSPRFKGDSHMHDSIDFFCPWMDKSSTQDNSSLEFNVGERNGVFRGELVVLMHQGFKVQES